MKRLGWFLMAGVLAMPLFILAAGEDGTQSNPAPAAQAAAPSFSDFKGAKAAGDSALEARHFDEAASDYGAAVELATSAKGKSYAANAQGLALMKARNWKEAKAAFDRAIGFDAKNKVALGNSGFVSHKMYEYGLTDVEGLKEAVKQLEACNAIDASYKPELLERAKADLEREKSYAAATPVADPDLKSMNYKSLIDLGDKAQTQGQFDLALKAFQQAEAVAVSPKSKGSAANRQGMALLNARRPHESVSHFERAVAAQPGEKIFQNNLGLSYWTLYDSGKGTVADLKKSVERFYKSNSIDASFHQENLVMALDELKAADPEAAKAYSLKKEEASGDDKASANDAADPKDSKDTAAEDSK